MTATMREAKTMMTADGTVRLTCIRSSAAWLDVFRYRPLLGRWLRVEEERPDADVVVIGADLWRRFLASTPNILERPIVLDGRTYNVVGVMPEEAGGAFWLPLAATPAQADATTFVGVTARVRDGVSLANAAAEINAIGLQLRGTAQEPGAAPRFELVGLQEERVARVRPALQVLAASVAVVLLIVCANVANLLLARGTTREREMGIRRALGAGRPRIVRQLLTESVILAIAGGLGGVLVATGGVELMKSLAAYGLPERFRGALGPAMLDGGVFPRIDEVGIDSSVLAFVVAIAIVTGVLFGLAPALRLSGVESRKGLASGDPRVAGAGRRNRIGQALAVAQIGMATMLLVVTGLLVQSFIKLSRVDIGFDLEALSFELVTPGDLAPERKVALAYDLSERLRALPGVTAVGFTNRPPLSRMGSSWSGPVVPLGRDWLAVEPADRAQIRAVSTDYLHALGVKLKAGAWASDRSAGLAPILVNDEYARRFFGDASPIGETIRWGTVGQFEVVGVVENLRWSMPTSADEPVELLAFLEPRRTMPLFDEVASREDLIGGVDGTASFVVRVSGDPLGIAADLRVIAREVDPTLAIDGITTMDRVLSGLHTTPRFYAVLLTIFGAIAAFVAAIGIYGVMAYNVMQRTREFGIRTALGARPPQIIHLVLGQATALVAVGIVVGLVGAVALTRYLASMLFGLTPMDVPTYVAVATLFTGVALLACYAPARWATKGDPLKALRFD
jgi:putative ABC transport system permease protein